MLYASRCACARGSTSSCRTVSQCWVYLGVSCRATRFRRWAAELLLRLFNEALGSLTAWSTEQSLGRGRGGSGEGAAKQQAVGGSVGRGSRSLVCAGFLCCREKPCINTTKQKTNLFFFKLDETHFIWGGRWCHVQLNSHPCWVGLDWNHCEAAGLSGTVVDLKETSSLPVQSESAIKTTLVELELVFLNFSTEIP